MIKLRSLVLVLAMLSPGLLKAQFFADQLLDFGRCSNLTNSCDRQVDNPHFAIDSDSLNFTTLATAVGTNELAFLELGFSSPAPAGSFVATVVADSNEVLSQQLLQTFIVSYYTASDSLVKSTNETYQQNVPILTPNFDQFLVATSLPEGNYEVTKMRIELRDTANVTNSIRVYGGFYYVDNMNCGPDFGSNLISALNCRDSVNVADGSDDTYGLFELATGFNSTATVTVGLNGVEPGDYVAFEISSHDDSLQLGAAPQLTLEIFDGAGAIVATRSEVISGDFDIVTDGENTYFYGVTIPDTLSGTIDSARLSLVEAVSTSATMRVYRAFGINFQRRIGIIPGDTICLGDQTTITAFGTGLTDFLWSTGATTPSITVEKGGLYFVEALDINGCRLTGATLVIDGIMETSPRVTASACQDSTGSIEPNITGGSGNYTFLWSDGDSTLNRTNLPAGVYTLQVTDTVMGCNQVFSYALSDQKGPYVSTIIDPATCSNNDGIASVQVIGIGPFTYSWSNGSTNDSLVDVPAGTYNLMVTDAQGCKTSKIVEVSEESGISLVANVSQPNCGMQNGSVVIGISGGSGSFDYYWSNGMTSKDLNPIGYGFYNLRVTDRITGCIEKLWVEVQNMNAPAFSIIDLRGESCLGGDARVQVDSLPRYTIRWEDGFTGWTRDSIKGGEYTFRMKKVNGTCDIAGFVDVPKYEAPKLKATVRNSCFALAEGNGKITIETIGGSQISQIDWSNGANGLEISDLDTGIYIATIVDNNGCTQSICARVGGRDCEDFCDFTFYDVVTANQDGFNDFWVVDNIAICPDNKLEIFNRWGNVVYNANGYQNDWEGQMNDGDRLPEGTYFYILKVNSPVEEVYKGMISLKYN